MNRILLIIVILLSVCTRSYSSDSLQIKRNYINTIGKALDKLGENMPYSAIDILETLKDTSKLDNNGYNILMLAYNFAKKDDEAISLYKEWESNEALVKEATLREKISMYSGVAQPLTKVGRYEEAILMIEKYIDGLKRLDDNMGLVLAYAVMSETYDKFGDVDKAVKFLNYAIRLKMDLLNATNIDILNEKIHDENLADLYVTASNYARKKGNLDEMDQYLALSCACGNKSAIELMNKLGLKYKKTLKSLKKGFKIDNQGFYEKSY